MTTIQLVLVLVYSHGVIGTSGLMAASLYHDSGFRSRVGLKNLHLEDLIHAFLIGLFWPIVLVVWFWRLTSW